MIQNKFEILKIFTSMQEENSMLKIYQQNNVVLTFCKNNSEEWWNYALLEHTISKEQLENIEAFFKAKNRASSIYFTDGKKNKSLKNFLKNKGYKLSAKDSWLFWNNGTPKIDKQDIIEVKNDSDFEKWIKTYLESYPDNDPKNPYGEQSEFAQVLKKSWYFKKARSSKKYYLASKDNKPVAVAALTNFNGVGYISEVGSVPLVRGEGYGKIISLHCVKESLRLKNKYHCLMTEKDLYPYEFYKRIGFTPDFESVLYSKK